MSSIKIREFKYLVVETGYTSRLFHKLDELKKRVQEQDEEDEDPILYIDDNIWGIGLYRISPDTKTIEKIQDALGPNRRGLIVFRCRDFTNAICLVEVLAEQQYCGCFSMTSLYEMELINGDILVMHFDCESG